MAGLVGYASSDDEGDDEKKQSVGKQQTPKATTAQVDEAEKNRDGGELETEHLNTARLQGPAPSHQNPDGSKHQEPAAALIGPIPQHAVPLGPSLPPVDASITITTTTATTLSSEQDAAQAPPPQPPLSPYSATRALIHDLTLPSVPNLDIPPSPPGSPPPGANKKLDQFLDLKRKGTHFNSKLEHSAALRNPALMDKLLAYVDIDDAAQYETTLPADLWDPRAFPEWAFRDRLKKTREKISKEKEADKTSGSRTCIDFVPSVTSSSSGGSTAVTGGLVSRGEKRKGGWR